MNELIDKSIQNIKYNLLSFVSFVIASIGYLGFKLTVCLFTVGISYLTQDYIGDFGLMIGYYVGLFVGVILFTGIHQLIPYTQRLDKLTKKYKPYPFKEKYGKDYPQPKSEDFGITKEEFKDYNNRFQFFYIKLLFTYGFFIASSIYLIKLKIYGGKAILLMGGIAVVALIFDHIFEFWNKKISKKHKAYSKIHKYQEAVDIYYKILKENTSW